MFKRISVILLALCCAFCFISQPVSATGVEVLLTTLEIGMVVAGAFGLTFAANAGYESFGNSLHDSVISLPGSVGSDWWNRSLAGNIVLTGMDASVKAALYACAKKAADALPQTGQDQYTFTFTPTCYVLGSDGSIVSDYRSLTISLTSIYGFSPIMIQYCVNDGENARYYISFFSNFPFSDSSSSKSGRFHYYSHVSGGLSSEYFEPARYKNFVIFDSWNEFYTYRDSLLSASGGNVSSAGGATAAYPTYGYDGVNLPNIDLKQAGLIAEDGTSTVSDLIAQLQSGAITWEDYIGTVAPGQTATITLTDADGATATYTLVNTGVGTRVETGTDVTEATEPVVVPVPGELTGTLADTDVRTFVDTLAKTIAKPFADVIEKVQAIPQAITEALSRYKPSSPQNHFTIDLKEFFPFCIPFDLYDFFTCLNADPVAPVIEWAIPLPSGEMYPMELDLSVFDSVAQLLRRLELLLFCVGLAFKTRDLIKG